MILADKISNLRREKGWSQEELSEKLDVSRQSISKWESGASIPDINRVIQLSEIFGVSTDYLLREDEGNTDTQNYSNPDTKDFPRKRIISLEEANDFMDKTKQASPKIALGTMLCIFSPIVLLALLGLSQFPNPIIGENAAAGIGVVVLIAIIAVAVFLFISAGTLIGKYEFLEKEDIGLDYGVAGIVEKRRAEHAPSHSKYIPMGVILCIISCLPVIGASFIDESGVWVLMMVCVLLLMIGIGVYLLVWTCTIEGSFQKLLQDGDYTPQAKENEKKYGWFASLYWCIVVAAYLFMNFVFHMYQYSWIIYPVAGVLFGGIMAALKRKK